LQWELGEAGGRRITGKETARETEERTVAAYPHGAGDPGRYGYSRSPTASLFYADPSRQVTYKGLSITDATEDYTLETRCARYSLAMFDYTEIQSSRESSPSPPESIARGKLRGQVDKLQYPEKYSLNPQRSKRFHTSPVLPSPNSGRVSL
jgi:hypothetical protein